MVRCGRPVRLHASNLLTREYIFTFVDDIENLGIGSSTTANNMNLS